jgi:hypothetical protein
MRISHLEIERCSANPRAWVVEQLTSTSRPRWGYAQVTKLSIYRYHRTNSDEAAFHYFDDILPRVGLREGQRADEQRQNLAAYIDWHRRSSVLVADVRLRIDLQLAANVIMGGEISRIDIALERGGYCAVLLTETGAFSPQELRLPLIQRAIALKYRREEREVWVGFQRLDGTALALTQFPKAAITRALIKARSITAEIAAAYAILRP